MAVISLNRLLSDMANRECRIYLQFLSYSKSVFMIERQKSLMGKKKKKQHMSDISSDISLVTLF